MNPFVLWALLIKPAIDANTRFGRKQVDSILLVFIQRLTPERLMEIKAIIQSHFD